MSQVDSAPIRRAIPTGDASLNTFARSECPFPRPPPHSTTDSACGQTSPIITWNINA